MTITTDTPIMRMTLYQSRDNWTHQGAIIEVDGQDWRVIDIVPAEGTDYFIASLGVVHPCRVVVTLGPDQS